MGMKALGYRLRQGEKAKAGHAGIRVYTRACVWFPRADLRLAQPCRDPAGTREPNQENDASTDERSPNTPRDAPEFV